MGFSEVYDYGTGKQNWLASGLPVEGQNAEMIRAGTLAREDVPTCGLQERLGDVKRRLDGWDTCVVVNEQRVVLGLLREKELAGDADRTVEEAMRSGPSTFRPHVSAAELGDYLARHNLANAPITTGEGVLVGLLLQEDAARVAEHKHGEHDSDG